ncbi:S41 family peptidase [Rhizohabitans arisaemae]|uniref:S41 family peptidase n=1 Tax=Rhizohabitans arisaemae TaxID=2720610 RepID=UPI0024B068FD|nr:S41 family peptidase [Rhizohabitans arisaemae]
MNIKILIASAALLLTVSCTGTTAPQTQGGTAPADRPAACERFGPNTRPPAEETPTTIDVVEQAYFCILAEYYGGATLDTRPLLVGGFAALTDELGRGGRDVAEATMPALTGDRQADWAAFETVYRRITDRLPEDAKLRERLAAVTLEAVVAELRDNHARWSYGGQRPPDYHDGDLYDLGLKASVSIPQVSNRPGTALPPLFVATVLGGAAKAAGLRPGDVIESVGGAAPFVGGRVTPAAVAALHPRYPQADPVRIGLLRPGTGRRWTVTLKPGLYQPDPAAVQRVTSKPLPGGLAYVRLSGFAPDAATRVLEAITALGTGRRLTGVVLDLRGNGGGSPAEVNRLLGGFAHGKVTAYHCTADGACDTERTDDGVTLLNLPLAVLTDRGCASACEHFSAAVKDLGLGRLVGTRTAGAISGPAQPYLLSNGTVLGFPAKRHLGPGRELIDRIGVAPDHHVPLTAEDAAAGRDPALAKAQTLLRG